jgi:hypothetical protein
LGDFTSYLYRWATGSAHLSFKEFETQAGYDAQIDVFRHDFTDVGESRTMEVPDLSQDWRAFLDGIRSSVAKENLATIERRLEAAGATRSALAPVVVAS